MTIVGGVYDEYVTEPHGHETFGSGLRAAAVLASSCPVSLHTVVDEKSINIASAIAASFQFSLHHVARESPIEFRYQTPISRPEIVWSRTTVAPIEDDFDEPALVFGMIERVSDISAPMITYDPQSPSAASIAELTTMKAGRLAVVANAGEIRGMGRDSILSNAVDNIRNACRAEAIIVKRGPYGVSIFTPGKAATSIGPYQTDQVTPIGSGDVFSAAFAWAWSVAQMEPVASAELACAVTSSYCGRGQIDARLRVGVKTSQLATGTLLEPKEEPVKVYVAGPFFNLAQRLAIDTVVTALKGLGANVFSPFHDVGLGGDEVAEKDLQGLNQSETVLCLLDGCDPGTLFEAGFANACGKPIVGFSATPNSNHLRMLRGVGITITSDLTSAIYNSIWLGMKRA